jgi:NTP pyrophosphatase (non-canonical NTP hydrolase)
MNDWREEYGVEFTAQVRTEVRLAREKFGEQGVLTLLAALQEESGEVAKAVLQKLPPPELWSEAVQVAAMALRIAVEHAIDQGDTEGE